MNNEIKEIELWKEKTKGIFHITEYTRFWNYITNLQQEIKEANDSITWWTNRFKAVERDNRELKEEIERQSKAQVILDDMLADYGYRIDKAIEYINTHDDCIYQEKGLNEDSLNDLLNILQGENNDN